MLDAENVKGVGHPIVWSVIYWLILLQHPGVIGSQQSYFATVNIEGVSPCGL